MAELTFVDDDGERVELDADEAASLLEITGELEAATVSACPDCREPGRSRSSRSSTCSTRRHRTGARERARSRWPTTRRRCTSTWSTVAARCDHRAWRDPGHEEWLDAVSPAGPAPRRP